MIRRTNNFLFKFKQAKMICFFLLFINNFQYFNSTATNPVANPTTNNNKLNLTTLYQCDNKVPESETDCHAFSNDFFNCCFLKTPISNKAWQQKLCMPVQSNTSIKPSVLLFGLGFETNCGNYTSKSTTQVVQSKTPSKYFPCGPYRPQSINDCLPYSLDDNTCCLGSYLVDYLSITVKECVYFGSKYNKTDRDTQGFNTTVFKIGKTKVQCNSKFNSVSMYTLLFVILFYLLI